MSYAEKVHNALLGVIAEMASDPSRFAEHPGQDFTRDRKIPFEGLIEFMLAMQGNSLNKEMYDHFKYMDDPPTESAFIQQRAKLNGRAMEYLFHEFHRVFPDGNTYNGFHLYAADGTDVNIARDPNSDTYIANGRNKGYNQFHVNTVFDLQNKTYIDCIIQPRPQMDERKALVKMLTILPHDQKNIIIADRGYESLNLFEHIHRMENVDYVIRVKNTFIKETAALPMEELDCEITINLVGTQTKADKELFAAGKAKYIKGKSKYGGDSSWDFELPFEMTLRVVRFQINDSGKDKYETVVTSLDRFRFPLREIKKLYHMRWGIETSFRELKYAVGLTNFHAKKEQFIIQEIFARLVIYNYCERITMHVVIDQSDKRKHLYQVNFTMAIYICRDYFRCCRDRPPPDIEATIRSYILPVREGRHDERKIKPKQNVYFLYRVA